MANTSTLQIKNAFFEDEEKRKEPDAAADSKLLGQFVLFDNGKYCLNPETNGNLFIGKYNSDANRTIPVAIRRYLTAQVDDEKMKRELLALRSSMNRHENFIQYFDHTPASDGFTYYAIELCRYSVEDLITTKMTEPEYKQVTDVLNILSHEKIMHQTTLGLDYLHGLGFVHRNIHGRNVLVAEIPTSSGKHYVVKLSDFRFGKKIIKEGQQHSNEFNSEYGWIAPEMKDTKLGNVGSWTDVYILGCFFYYVLSGGHPPFGYKPSKKGDVPNREANITDGNYAPECWDVAKLSTAKFTDLIKDMTKRCPGDRTTLSRVLQYFQHDTGYFPLYDGVSKGIKPGLCVIINQQEFPEISTNFRILEPEVRHGSEKDAEALFDTFTGFGYDVRTYNNLTAEQLRQTLKDLAEEKDSMGQSIFKRYESLVVCLLSHGSLGTVMGIDWQPVNVLELQYEMFNSETCPDLNDKPKIFIIQACQGNIGQRMILRDPTNDDIVRSNSGKYAPTLNSELNVVPAALDGGQPVVKLSDKIKSLEGGQPIVTKISDKIKSQFRDVITLWSTIEGFVSNRNANTGSAFIQSLCKQLNDFGGRNSRDLYEAHLDVTQEITDHPVIVKKKLFDSNGQRVYRKYLYNQTPLFKSSACRKVAFQRNEK